MHCALVKMLYVKCCVCVNVNDAVLPYFRNSHFLLIDKRWTKHVSSFMTYHVLLQFKVILTLLITKKDVTSPLLQG